MSNQISDIIVSKVDKKKVVNGDIYHGIKSHDLGFKNFGEVYFSFINFNKIKGWKKHTKMTLNLLVPVGLVKFVFYDENKKIIEYIIGSDNYLRLTVPPNIWFGFQGLSHGDNLIMNLADIPHSDDEVEKKKINEIKYKWSIFE